MPLTLNGSAVTTNTLNGSGITSETLNGSAVYAPGGGGQTVTPQLSNCYYQESGGSYYVYWTVRNLDPSTATVYSEANDSTPDLYTNSLAYNATANRNQNMGSFFMGATVYATALASGKDLSEYTSFFVDI